MNVIFLDMDGVVNNSTLKNWICLPMKQRDGEYTQLSNWGATNIDPFLTLMEWCYNNNINIVISSTWRFGMTVELFNEYFDRYFFRNDMPKVVGLTSVILEPWMHRGCEIEDYINNNQISKYICLDDDVEDILEKIPKEYVYKTDNTVGLTQKDVDNIKSMWYNLDIKEKSK